MKQPGRAFGVRFRPNLFRNNSVATSWALCFLATDLQIQSKLRAELLSVPTQNPTMDELNALPYLDAVVRETLRLSPPLSVTMRMAMKDEVIPLRTPFVDKQGVLRDSIKYVVNSCSLPSDSC
jgi:hypothetical protein